MSHRIEPAGDPTSTFMLREGLQDASAVNAPSAGSPSLPLRYGLPLFEFLVVDPTFVFVSWEVTEHQLETARATFGAAFESRRLVVSIKDAQSGELLTERSLYGEVGRWFIELNHPGTWVNCQLEYVAGQQRVGLHTTAAVFVPRDREVAAANFEELSVHYGQDAQGRLSISGTRLNLPLWPAVNLSDLTGAGTAWDVPGGSSQLGIQLRPLLPGSGPPAGATDNGGPDD